MSINLDKIRARLDSVNSNGKGGGQFWRPKDGTQVIRIVPTKDGDPFKDYWFHYNLGAQKGGVLCPKRNHDEPCPICDFKDTLWKEYNNSQDGDTMKLAKDMSPRQRFFSPVLVRGEESDGIRIWGFGKEAYTSLLNLVLNPEYGDITDTDEGTDLTLSYGKPPGANFPKTVLTPRRRSSPLCDDALGGDDECNRLMENIPGFDNLFDMKSHDELQEILDNVMESISGSEETETEAVPYQSRPAAPVSDVLSAFNELSNS